MTTRLERVVLELQDEFSGPILRAAASVEVLDSALDRLSGSAVKVRRPTEDVSRSTSRASRDIDDMGRKADRAGSSIDRLSGRVSLLASAVAILGPGLIPIGAIGIPALSGLAAQFGFTALGALTLIGAFQGVGDALKAVNTAQLEPTAANLQAAREAMAGISPEARSMVHELQSLTPQLKQLRDIGAAGFFPGAVEGLDQLETTAPRIRRIVAAVSTELGSIASEAGTSLASDRWAPFLDFLGQEAPQALSDMASTAGNTTHALAELWMAFDPANDDFSSFLLRSSADLDKWATGLSKTQGFADFLAYVEKEGPQVADTVGAISNALVQVLEAGAPIGGPVLHGLEDLANVLAKVADSDLGAPILAGIAAWRLYTLAANAARSASTAALEGRGGRAGAALTSYREQLGAVTALEAADRRLAAAQATVTAADRAATVARREYNASLRVMNTGIGLGVTPSVATQARVADNLAKLELANYGVRDATEKAAVAEATRSKALRSTVAGVSKTAAGVAALTVASTGMADGIGLSNTATLGLAASMGGPLAGAAGATVGLLLDLSHGGDTFADTLTRINAAARAGDMTAFESQLDQAKKQLADLQNTSGVGDFFSDWKKKVGGIFKGDVSFGIGGVTSPTLAAAESSGKAEIAAKKSAAALHLQAEGFTLTAAGARTAAMDTDTFSAAVDRMEGRLAQRGSMRDLEGAIDDYRATLKKAKSEAAGAGEALIVNGKINIKGDSGAGRELQAALDHIADSGLKAAQAVNDVGQRSRILDKTRAAFIRAATAAGIARVDARRLANQLISLDQLKPVVTPKVNTGPAKNAVDQLVNSITSRHPTMSVTVKPANSLAGLLAPGGADGMTVPGQRHPYGDKILIAAAPGEEVITNRHGEADRFRADRAAGRIPAYADGGTVRPTSRQLAAMAIQGLALGGTVGSYSAGAGVSVYFPAPDVLSAAVKAADAIAAAAANTARSAADTRSAHLDDLHLSQQIRDTQASLLQHEDKVIKVRNKHGKGTHNKTLKGKGRLSLIGLDRTTAQAELADLKAQQAALAGVSAAAQTALDTIRQARTDAAQSVSSGLDLFSSGSASRATRDADRYVADVAAAGDIITQLRARGASPLLLQQMKQHIEQGDARAAVKLGRAFLAQPALLGQLNASLATLGSVSAGVSAITTDPRFLGTGSWDATAQATKTVNVELGADPSSWLSEVKRVVSYEVQTQLAQAVS